MRPSNIFVNIDDSAIYIARARAICYTRMARGPSDISYVRDVIKLSCRLEYRERGGKEQKGTRNYQEARGNCAGWNGRDKEVGIICRCILMSISTALGPALCG